MSTFIDPSSMALLPFQATPVDQWRHDVDVRMFLSGLDGLTTVLAPDGTEQTSHSDYYATYNFEQALEDARSQLKTLNEDAAGAVKHGKNIARMHHWSKSGELDRLWEAQVRGERYVLPRTYEPTDPLEAARLRDFDAFSNPVVGQATKYFVAWDGIFAETLAESWFFSLPHTLEANYDVRSSFLLACHAHYRQSLLLLRVFLEDVVLPLYFLAHDREFERWKNDDDYFLPRFSGRDSVTADLLNRRVFSEDLVRELRQTYSELGKAVHGAERHLGHAGMVRGASPPGFRVDRLVNWAEWFVKVLDIGIRVVVTTNEHWSRHPRRSEVCQTCHGKDFDVTEQSTGWTVVCKTCGDVTHRTVPPESGASVT